MQKKWGLKRYEKFIVIIILILIVLMPFIYSNIIKQPEDIKRWQYFEFEDEDLGIFVKIHGKVPIKTGDKVNCIVGAIYQTSKDRTIMVNISGSYNVDREEDDFDFEYYTGKIYLSESPEKSNETPRPERSWTHEGDANITFNYPGDIYAQVLIRTSNGETLTVFHFENLIFVENSDTLLLQNIAVSTLLLTSGSIFYSTFRSKDENDY